MNADRFDAVVKRIANHRLTRRRALVQGGAGLAAGAIAVVGLTSAAPRADAASTTGGMAEAVNAFRVQNGLPAIPVSPALTKVAQAHVRDLIANHPENVPGCNMHSWSVDGQWKVAAAPGAKGGCFTGKFTDAENHIMWDKPKEIAGYPGNGFENAYWNSAGAKAEDAVQAWVQPGDPHRDVIMNLGIWTTPWKALGGWVEGDFAVSWFGNETDTSPMPATTDATPITTTAATCPAGQANCGAGCVDVTSDANNCGACGTVCGQDQTCTNGICASTACPTGQTDCGAGCIDTTSDASNCGGCGTICDQDQTCNNGTCAAACPDGQADCGFGCADITGDSSNCGACGNVCDQTQTCSNGTCAAACPDGQADCGFGCTDLTSDSNNCGACGTVCDQSQTCSDGTCQ